GARRETWTYVSPRAWARACGRNRACPHRRRAPWRRALSAAWTSAPASAWRASRRPSGRVGELDLAEFQGAPRPRRPRRVGIELEISPPARRGLGVAFELLQQQREIEDRVGVIRVGLGCRFQRRDRITGAAGFVENIRQVVPGRPESRVGPRRLAV